MHVRNILSTSTEILENLFCFEQNIKLKIYIVPLRKLLSLENATIKWHNFEKLLVTMDVQL